MENNSLTVLRRKSRDKITIAYNKTSLEKSSMLKKLLRQA